nr:putative reverse transcriptase domain-containing protein [Tanacetum cinerariifolium]
FLSTELINFILILLRNVEEFVELLENHQLPRQHVLTRLLVYKDRSECISLRLHRLALYRHIIRTVNAIKDIVLEDPKEEPEEEEEEPEEAQQMDWEEDKDVEPEEAPGMGTILPPPPASPDTEPVADIVGFQTMSAAQETARVENIRLRRELDEAQMSNSLLCMGLRRTQRDLYKMTEGVTKWYGIACTFGEVKSLRVSVDKCYFGTVLGQQASKKHLYLNIINNSILQSISGRGYRGQASLILYPRLNLWVGLQIMLHYEPRVPHYPFNYPTRRLTMEEILAKFIDEGVTTKGGKMTSEATPDKEINETGINKNKPPKFEQDVQEKPHDDGVENKYLRSPLLDTARAMIDVFNRKIKLRVGDDEKEVFSQVKTYFWEEPYAFKLYSDNIMRRCMAGSETLKILAHYHSGSTGGHHSASVTAKKVYESGFDWPSVFKYANEYKRRCDACQRSENISSRNEMPQNNIQLNELAELKDGENTRIYKERTKKWHDSRLRGDTDFKEHFVHYFKDLVIELLGQIREFMTQLFEGIDNLRVEIIKPVPCRAIIVYLNVLHHTGMGHSSCSVAAEKYSSDLSDLYSPHGL